MKQNHKSMFTCGKQLCLLLRVQLPGVTRGLSKARRKETPSGEFGAPGRWWPNKLAPKR